MKLKSYNMNEEFNISDLFYQSVEKYPEKIALIDRNKEIPFKNLEDEVTATANWLMDKGIVKGDRVLVFVPMSIDLYRIVLAIFKIGAIAVFLDEWVNRKRMVASCQIVGCKAIIGIWKVRLLALFSKELRKIPLQLGLNYKKSSFTSQRQPGITSEKDTALITFTTGSTGVPKAANRTHGFLKEQFQALVEKIDPQPTDIDMPVLPIVLLINLGVGCTSVIADFNVRKPNTLSILKILVQIKAHQVNRIVASPYFIKQLSKHLIHNKLALPQIKKVFTGGAPVFPSEATLYCRAFPNTHIEIVYGSTEAEPISSIMATDLLAWDSKSNHSGLLVGEPYHRTQVKIIMLSEKEIICPDMETLDAMTCPSGTIGEIIVSGPHVLTEYFNNKEAQSENKIFIEDTCWHRTGDSGYLDTTGRLYLTGRCKSLIYHNENVISPFVYEKSLSDIDEVELGTVINKNDQILIVLEVLVSTNKEAVTDSIKKIGLYFDDIVFLQKMPRDPRHNSKIDYSKIAQL